MLHCCADVEHQESQQACRATGLTSCRGHSE
jgi:hypothetical protein